MKKVNAKSSAPAKGADMGGEFQPSVHAAESEPGKGSLDYTVHNYGDSRMQDFLLGGEGIEYVMPGDEGNVAVSIIKAMGGISSWDKSEDLMTKGPAVVVGTEKQKLNK